MNREELLEQLQGLRIGWPLHWSEVTDSTSARAVQAVRDGVAGDGAVFVAGEQTAGRGTGGNRWTSAARQGLWMSLVLRSDVASPPAVTLMPAIAVAHALHRCGVDAHLKWPNDVLVEDRKIAGILVESVLQAAGASLVVGIGVNLNQPSFDGELADIACSARMVLGHDLSIPAFFGDLMLEIDQWRSRPADWRMEWMRLSRMIGSSVRIVQQGEEEIVTAVDLSATGALIIRDHDGVEREIIHRTGIDLRLMPQRGRHPVHARADS